MGMKTRGPVVGIYNDDKLVGLSGVDIDDAVQSFGSALGGQAWRQVATRSRVPGNRSGAVFQLSSKSYHRAPAEAIKSLKIGIPNWYVNAGVEAGIGGPATVRASIEAPAGNVIGRFTFGGSYSGTVEDLQTIESDELVLGGAIPAGQKFWISINYVNAAGIPFTYTDTIGADQAGGDIAQYAVSGVPDVTATGAALTNTQNGVGFYPAYIIARSTNRAFTIAGDSIAAGKGDSVSDNTGFGGFAERAIGPSWPFINIASPGASVDSFQTPESFLRRQLVAFTSDVLFHAGINNVAGGMPEFTIVDYISKARALVPGHDFYATTMCPITTGAWAAADGSDQVLNGSEAKRNNANKILRGRQTMFTRVLDLEPSARMASAPNKWKQNGTADGVHPAQSTAIAMAAAIAPQLVN